MALTRPVNPGSNGPGGQPTALGDASVLFPAIAEYLSSEQWDDGSPRQTSTLLIFVEDGSCKLCLNDRGAGRKAWIASKTFEAAFSSLEAGLASGAVEWRQDKPSGARRSR